MAGGLQRLPANRIDDVCDQYGSAAAHRLFNEVLQRPGYPKHRLPFVVTTEPCLTSTIEKAMNSLAKLDVMLEKPLTLQILVPEDKPE